MRRAFCLLATLALLQAAPAAAQTRAAAAAHLKRADLLSARNRLDEALASYDKAVGADPAWAAAYVRRGVARRAQGDLDGSIADYEKAGELDPRSTADNEAVAESYNRRGMNRLNRLEVGPAVADFTKAIAHHGSEPIYFYLRGQALLIDEELERAVADFNRADALNRRRGFLTVLTHLSRGYALLLGGKKGEAQRDFDKARQLPGGQRIDHQLHLPGIEAQIRERRRRRAEASKGVT